MRYITFPTNVIWNTDVESNMLLTPNSFDHIVSTHVLCSVENTE